jgi:diadenosine tetraphosphate (Ap4A) HIT family hydrolase
MSEGSLKDGCRSCAGLAVMEPLSGVPYVYVGDHFVVDHCVPIARPGWFVIVTRRHAAALHELSSEEWQEFAALLPRLVAAVHSATTSEKEYVLQLAEAPGFQHIHWHIVAVHSSDTARGTEVFQHLKTAHPMTAADIAPICDAVRAALTD